VTKAELVNKIAEITGFTKKDSERFVDAFVNVVMDALKNGDEVNIVGFGKFAVAHRKARKGVNPQTGEPIEIPAKDVPVFKPGKKLRDAVKNK